MNVVNEFLISLFESTGLYSTENGLSEHLKGLDMECNDYTMQSTYSIIFLCLFIINSLLMLNYYYGILNRIPYNRFLWWFLNVLFGAIVLFTISYCYANNDFVAENFCNTLSITTSDCIGFGFTSAIYSIVWSLILSGLIKWKSSVNKKVPF